MRSSARRCPRAGDVNGDSQSDVIIGAYAFDNGQLDEGRVFVYHGSQQLGLETLPAWVVESNQERASMGFAVDGAGDVNGDGFADVIVGAPEYDNVQVDEGRVDLYYGNQGDGFDRIPRQARSDDSAPIDLPGPFELRLVVPGEGAGADRRRDAAGCASKSK